jgi:hypothetical protein
MIRIFDADGTLHFSAFKKLALSGVQYLHAVNSSVEPTRDMRIGTIVHFLLLGPRPTAKPLVRYTGAIRRGKEWDAFEAANVGSEIVSLTEWNEAEQIAESVRRSPIARVRLEGARLEVPLEWEESGIKCSTSGVDIIPVCGDIGDLKTTPTTYPPKWQAHAFNMLYPQQLAFYRRGMLANGHDPKKLFVLGVERKAPFEVVELDLTPELLSLADKSLTLWFEDLRRNMLSIPEPETIYDWPGYAQAPVQWAPPKWAAEDDEDELEGEEVAA